MTPSPASIPPGRVLPTLNADGSRRQIRPRSYHGRFERWRGWVAWGLIALFFGLPFVRINGHPALFFDLLTRHFHVFGRTFLATDGVLLMLVMLSLFVGIFWISALFGRAWCGWGCPQTVYMEYVFRPIERWLEGNRHDQAALDRAGGGYRRGLKLAVFALLSVLLGNVFLAYFVGVERLQQWVTQSPFDNPGAFLVMAVTSSLVFLDFAWFREQMCTVVCPYARLQAVLLDPRSLIIGYDARRGEPRGKGRERSSKGDCIDCGACVIACPTGIDIREGLQLECIACALCIDACDSVMDKVGSPRGLVRYASQLELAEPSQKRGLLRPRVVLYPALIAVFAVLLLVIGGGRTVADITLLRGIGLPFVIVDGGAQNQIRIKIHNRQPVPQNFKLELLGADGAQLIAPENPLSVGPEASESTTVFVIVPQSQLVNGERPVRFRVSDGKGFVQELPYRLLGPIGR